MNSNIYFLTSMTAYDKLSVIVSWYWKVGKILGKEEFRIKVEEINHPGENKDYKGAIGVVGRNDWGRGKEGRNPWVRS